MEQLIYVDKNKMPTEMENNFKFLGRFPFTFEGEKEAGKRFISYLSSIGKEPKYKEKRKYKRKLPIEPNVQECDARMLL